MKKLNLSLAALAVAATVSLPAQSAVLLGAKAGVDAWYADAKINDVRADDTNVQGSYYVAFEHFIPLVPNAKIRYTDVSSQGANTQSVAFTQYDLIAYYEILDNDLISFDIGLNLQKFEGNFGVHQFDEWQPAVYSDVRLGIPATPVSLFGTFSFGSYDETSTVDAEAGVLFTLGLVAADLNFKAGYRVQDYDFNYFGANPGKFMNDGFFGGVELNF
ncbi:Fe3+-hydroxamate ABC transporter substrate-binding protein [Enterovibrio norvegicus FF-162]|uniref:TIGR04219 family outer membrane beta-barrel protein n=1 Tax=Enterovibrio norvegicus TaxID=188144 RepID=UPI0003065E33|nr:TIGR04219 family outer membrane beta-barrel protein [Enterovibrio norvegicus]OEE87653.1 Fe3+-hydroxamate ABC transporter substrate-binding protein [Enterovibrio norvegicus FF-162]